MIKKWRNFNEVSTGFGILTNLKLQTQRHFRNSSCGCITMNAVFCIHALKGMNKLGCYRQQTFKLFWLFEGNGSTLNQHYYQWACQSPRWPISQLHWCKLSICGTLLTGIFTNLALMQTKKTSLVSPALYWTYACLRDGELSSQKVRRRWNAASCHSKQQW